MTLSFPIVRKVCPITVNRPRVHVETSKNSASSFKIFSIAKAVIFIYTLNIGVIAFFPEPQQENDHLLMFVELGWSYAMLVHR
jgi:hypothetical protein